MLFLSERYSLDWPPGSALPDGIVRRMTGTATGASH
jgi:hypothetical protein